jgi:nucleoside-diphosphate-sugar epimerase
MILVTGSEGFVGRQLCGNLQKAGCSVLGLDRLAGPPRTWESVHVDLTDRDAVLGAVKDAKPKTVIHLASLLNTASREDPIAAARINIGGSVNLMEAAHQARVDRFLYLSSASIYGPIPSEAVTEDDSTQPGDVYGAAKRFVETLGSNFAARNGFSITALRVPNIVGLVPGPGRLQTSSPWRTEIFEALVRKWSRVLLPFKPETPVAMIHVSEVASALMTLMNVKRPEYAAYNAPSETWVARKLGSRLEELGGGALTVDYGRQTSAGVPFLDDRRFTLEFSWKRRGLDAWLAETTRSF